MKHVPDSVYELIYLEKRKQMKRFQKCSFVVMNVTYIPLHKNYSFLRNVILATETDTFQVLF